MAQLSDDDGVILRVLNRIVQEHILERRDPAACSCGWIGDQPSEPVWWTDHVAHAVLAGLRDADIEVRMR